VLEHGVGLAGEQRLVGLELATLLLASLGPVQQRPVDHDLVTGAHPQHVAAHDRLRRELDLPAVAQDEHRGPVQQL
jgi:hypothetical protein